MNPMSEKIATALSVMSACGDDQRVAEFQNAVSNRANGGTGAQALAVPVQFAIEGTTPGSIADLLAQVPALAPVLAKVNTAKWTVAIGSVYLAKYNDPGDFIVRYITQNGDELRTFVSLNVPAPQVAQANDVVFSNWKLSDQFNSRFNGLILIYIEN